MAILHRGLFGWFNLLVFVILIVVRLDKKVEWNWFIVFIPMWLYDNLFLIYIIFNMISHCKNGLMSSLYRKSCYMAIVMLKLCAQILICLKLEAPHLFLPAKVVLAPLLLLLVALVVDIFVHLVQQSKY